MQLNPPAPVPGSAELVSRRQLERSVALSVGERLRSWWIRLRLAHADIDYANRRLLEVQAPWIADRNWTSR